MIPQNATAYLGGSAFGYSARIIPMRAITPSLRRLARILFETVEKYA
jgi:hypothetical protein